MWLKGSPDTWPSVPQHTMKSSIKACYKAKPQLIATYNMNKVGVQAGDKVKETPQIKDFSVNRDITHNL